VQFRQAWLQGISLSERGKQKGLLDLSNPFNEQYDALEANRPSDVFLLPWLPAQQAPQQAAAHRRTHPHPALPSPQERTQAKQAGGQDQ
jgi:hypothetical protein